MSNPVTLERASAGCKSRSLIPKHLDRWLYPDFLFAVQRQGKGNRIVVLETKGDQLDNKIDTAYKRDLLNQLSDNFSWDKTQTAGTLELQSENGETVECALVLMGEWRAKLPNLLL